MITYTVQRMLSDGEWRDLTLRPHHDSLEQARARREKIIHLIPELDCRILKVTKEVVE